MTKNIPIANITNRFDVRRKIEEDHVLYLAGLIEGKANLPPIKVITIGEDQYAFIDGRHRAAAYALLGYDTIPASISKDSGDTAHYFGDALRSNWGGAKPPSRTDLEYTVSQMLDRGVSPIKIRESLNFVPASMLRLILTNSHSLLRKKRINKALDAVANGSKLADAAKEFSVEPDALKEAVTGRKRAASEQAIPLASIKSYISITLRASNTGIAKKIERVIKDVDDGETPSSTATQAIEAWEAHLKNTLNRMKDWKERVQMLENKPEPPPKTRGAAQ